MTLSTTLARVRDYGLRAEGLQRLLKYLGKAQPDDVPLPYAVIVDSNGLADALSCCCAEPRHEPEWRRFRLWCADQVQHLVTDARAINALRKYAEGGVSDEDIADARNGAFAAARDAALAEDAALAVKTAHPPAPGAALAARAVWAALTGDTLGAAESAAWAAAWAAWGAAPPRISARNLARDKALSAARAAQTEKFLEIIG